MTLISGLLAQVGILGTLVFGLSIICLLKTKSYNRTDTFAKCFFISILIGTEASCSGLQYSMSFWFGLLFYGCAKKLECVTQNG